MQDITFNTLPEAVLNLTKKIENIEKLLLIREENDPKEQTEKFLTIKEAAIFLNLAVATLYNKVSKGTIPVMKRGKRLYFSNIELLNYLRSGKKKMVSEIEAEEFLNKKTAEL